MNKPKSFFFAAATTIIMLFILGNWATSVQATGVTLIGATPTPTVRSVELPDIPLGEVPSAKELEELKAIVQSYVEIRYRALSVSDADDFKQNGFGDMVSDMHEAEVFLREEMAKLAVQIKHAELDHLRYVSYKVFLNFRSITIDPDTQVAKISVIEGNEVVYEISAELNPENPIISHVAGIEHTITLRKKQDQWRIISDTYYDDLWRMLRGTGSSTDEILRGADNLIRTMKPTLKGTDTETVMAFHNPLPDDPSSHSYIRADAVAYALRYWGQIYGDPNLLNTAGYNPNYDAFNPNDCQNFVSQALYEGGNASMFIPSPLPSPSTNGQSGWYSLYDDLQHASAWNDVNFFYTFVTSESWGEPSPGYEYYGEGPVGIDITISPGSSQVPADLDVGDVIQYDWKDPYTNTWDGYFDHTAIVVDIEGEGENRLPFVAAHTTNYDRAPYTLEPDAHYRFIHIERSNGYPPVKTEITARADDWGPNLYDNCTPPTLTTNNEIYFGACPFNGNAITSGFRFNNIQIPKGADLKYAYITFTVDGPYYWDTAPISVNIYEQTNSLTTVTWNIDGVVSQDYDTWVWRGKRTTPDLQTILEPIIDAEGWNSGQSLSIMFTNNSGGNVRRVMAIDRKLGTFYPPDPSLANSWTARLIAAYSLVDVTSPTVNSITRASASPTNASNIDFTVVFSEPVTGVDINDFTLALSGVSGASITSVSGSGDTYTVTVNTGSGEGTIRLDISNSNTITDLASNPLNGGYTGGETYGVDKTIPVVLSSVRVSASPTANANVDFTVAFSEPVTGVGTVAPFSDFTLTTTGAVTGATVRSVTPVSAAVYTVRVNTGSGDGTIRLNVISGGSIMDSAHNTFAIDFLTGEAYTIKKTLTVQSVGTYDGWVLESTETSGVGGTMNSAATTFNLGDDASNRQYVGILHFDTSSLPDTAVVTSATLKIKKYSLTGTNPFTILGNLMVDMRKPSFGAVDLAVGDFQAAAGKVAVAVFGTPVNNWYSAVLNSSGRNYINLTGATQFRLRFTTDDNNNGVADYMKFYSGDHGNAGVWPTLVIEYYVP